MRGCRTVWISPDRRARTAASVTVLTPADLPGPSGGSVYDQALCREARSRGLPLVEQGVPGCWPHPTRTDRRAFEAALAGRDHVLVDGIIAAAAPEEIAAASRAGTRVDVLFHSSTTLAGRDPVEEARALRAARRVVCTGSWSARWLAETCGIRARIAEPGVGAGPLARGSTPPQLLMLGAQTRTKNQLTALDALARIDDPPWRLVVAGPTDAEPETARRIADAAHRLGPAVTVRGAVHGDEREELWSGTDLLLHPSLSETYGMVVAEALARGIPAVVGRGTGAEALVHPDAAESTDRLDTAPPAGTPTDSGRSSPGTSVDAGDARALEAVLRTWLTRDDLRASWAEAARARRTEARTWSDTLDDVWEAIAS